MGCGDVCLLNDEGYRAIERSSRSPLINLTVPGELHDDLLAIGGGQQQAASLPPAPKGKDRAVEICSGMYQSAYPQSLYGVVDFVPRRKADVGDGGNKVSI